MIATIAAGMAKAIRQAEMYSIFYFDHLCTFSDNSLFSSLNHLWYLADLRILSYNLPVQMSQRSDHGLFKQAKPPSVFVKNIP